MPSVIQHKNQFQHNLDFVATFYVRGTLYLDWAITVYFYASIHLVEAFFASVGVHCRDHSWRNREVGSRLPAVAQHYMRLYNASRRARYEVW